MRSIEARFEEQQKSRPALSSFVNFAKAIQEQGFSRDMVTRHFNKLVSKDDYDKKDKSVLIDYLVGLSKK